MSFEFPVSSFQFKPTASAADWQRRPLRGLGVALLLLLLVGCGAKPGEVFPALENPRRWPDPPDPARIVYVGQLATSADLKPGVSGLEAFGAALFGKQDEYAMLTPMAVCTDGQDRVFVADSNAQCAHVFDLKTRQYAAWRPGENDPPLGQPVGIAWNPVTRKLLVSDAPAGSLCVFDERGKYAGQIGDGVLLQPVGLAVEAGTGRIFVADVKAHQIVVFTAEGKLEQRIGKRGRQLGEFNFPTNVALDGQGRMYVSDSLNFRVQQFSRDLKPLRQIGQKGDVPGCFAQPKGIALDSAGHVYVLDPQFENVQIFDDTGRLLLDFGEEGRGPGQFWLPASLFIDARNRIWVADAYNKRVQVFDYKGEAGNGKGGESNGK